ncbi:MAG: two-component regulator propeller domain-containing protein [Bacteroidota bacterium]
MKQKFYRLFLLYMIVEVSSAYSQTPFFKQVIVNRENLNLGFNSLSIDTNRILWLASTEGLLKYNGTDYISFALKSSGTPDEATAVFTDSKGIVWTGYNSGTIAFVTDSGLTSLVSEMKPKDKITSVFEDHNGVLWFTTGGDGVYIFQGKHLRHFGMNEGLKDDYCYTVEEDNTGRIWIGTDQGITLLIKDSASYKVAALNFNKQLPDVIIRDLTKDKNGNIWIGLQDSGVCRYIMQEKRIEMPQWSRNWKHGPVLDIYFNKNELWLGTEGSGVFYLDMTASSSLINYSGYGEFTFNDIRKVISDPEENLWMASGTGLIRSHSHWLTFMNAIGKEKINYVHTVYCSGSNDIYLTPDQGLLSFNTKGGNIRHYTITAGTSLIDIVSLYEDECGYLWVGTMGGGLFRLNTITGTVQRISNPDLNDASILSIDGSGDEVWLATFGGAFYCKIKGSCLTDKPDVEITKLDTEATLGNFYIYTVFVDSRNRVWFGTDKKGLTCYTNGKYYNYSTEQGLRSNTVYSITEDNKGAIWFSTPGEGICRFDGRTFHNYGKAEGLRELTITALKYVSFDRIVMVHKKGIDILHTSTGKIDFYGAENNLSEINPDLNSITVDQSGSVWIGTEKGIVIYNPILNINPAGPEVVLSNVTLIGSRHNQVSKHEFAYNQNSFVFDFTGIWYTDPARINYQYMLEGYNSNWISTSDKQVVFPNLPPGKYDFKVRASLSPSFTVSETTDYSFFIRKPAWKENWFITSVIVLIIIAGIIIIRNRDKRLKGIEALKKESVEYRFETLKSQVNPHFLFNSFNTLIAIIEKDKDVAIEYVEKLSDYFRNMIQHREKETIMLRDEIEMVKTYYYLQKKRFGEHLRLQINLSEKLLDSGKVPPLSLQLLIENAIKHNAVSRETPLTVEVFQASGNAITVKNNINVKLTPEISTGIGLQNIINRYKILSTEKVLISYDQDFFSITIPLI